MVVSFIGGGNRSTQRQPPTYLFDSYSFYFHFHFCDCIDRCNSIYCMILKKKATSNDFLSSFAGTGGNVAWLPTNISGLLALDISSILFCTEKKEDQNRWFRLIVFNATSNDISVISWQSVLLVEETRVPGVNHQPVASHWQTLLHNIRISFQNSYADQFLFFTLLKHPVGKRRLIHSMTEYSIKTAKPPPWRSGFPLEYAMVIFVFNDLRWEVVCRYWWNYWPSLFINLDIDTLSLICFVRMDFSEQYDIEEEASDARRDEKYI